MVYHLGDVVLGKMKGFPYWPGIVEDPPNELKHKKVKPNTYCIYFFGSKNYAFLDESNLKKYEPTTQDVKCSPGLMKAVKEMEAYISSSHLKYKRKSTADVKDFSQIQMLHSPDESAPSESSSKSDSSYKMIRAWKENTGIIQSETVTSSASGKRDLVKKTSLKRKQLGVVSRSNYINPDSVEQILDHKKSDDGTFQFLIMWKNVSLSEHTWEPLYKLHNCIQIIVTYFLKKEGHITPNEISPVAEISRMNRASDEDSSEAKKRRLDSKQYLDMPSISNLNPLDEEYEVETIIDHKVNDRGTIEFYIKWAHYPQEENTWEPLRNLENSLESVVDYFWSLLGHNISSNSLVTVFLQKCLVFDKTEKEKYFQTYVKKSGDCFPPVDYVSLERIIGLVPQFPKILKNDPFFLEITGKLRLKHLNHIVLQERVNQKLNLSRWEKEINTSAYAFSNAPIVVRNWVDLDYRPDFKYINKCFQNLPSPISFGCSNTCSCGPDCDNWIVEKGRTTILCIFKTENNTGWGVRTLENIAKGQFVDEFLGEIITSAEVLARRNNNKRTDFFDVDYIIENNSYAIDGREFGNVSSFIKHSSDPNLELKSLCVKCPDPDFRRRAIFAKQNIRPNEELTLDYKTIKICSPVIEQNILD